MTDDAARAATPEAASHEVAREDKLTSSEIAGSSQAPAAGAGGPGNAAARSTPGTSQGSSASLDDVAVLFSTDKAFQLNRGECRPLGARAGALVTSRALVSSQGAHAVVFLPDVLGVLLLQSLRSTAGASLRRKRLRKPRASPPGCSISWPSSMQRSGGGYWTPRTRERGRGPSSRVWGSSRERAPGGESSRRWR